MQIVYISNRLSEMAETLLHVRKYMGFASEILVFCPPDMVDDFKSRLPNVMVMDERILIKDRNVLNNLNKSHDENHDIINYTLRKGLSVCDMVADEFIMSDDDYRPIRDIEEDFFKVASGRYNAYFMTSIEHYVGFISQGIDTNRRNVPFHKVHRDMLRLLKSLGMPSLMYASHMPQIVNKNIFHESVEFFEEMGKGFRLDEWSTYFNFGLSRYPDLFSNKLYETMCWPYLNFSLCSPNDYSFELYYQDDIIKSPYADGELFEDIPKLFSEDQDAVNHEKIERYRRRQLDYYSGSRVYKGRDIRMNDGCSRDARGVLCMGQAGHCVTYGPYAKLTEGNYRAIIRFWVKKAAGDVFFRIDMCGNAGSESILGSTGIGRANASVQPDGSYACEIPFSLPTFFPDVELRTFVAAPDDIFILESVEFAEAPAGAEPEGAKAGAKSLAGRLRKLFSPRPGKASQPQAQVAAGGPAAPSGAAADTAMQSEYDATRRRAAPGKGLHLSLVAACYNVELYLERFLDSVFSQEGDFDRFEVILVDDGSTDRTARIVRQWQARFPDHIRYIYQENAGVCAARNAGLAMATGTWVSFPDPDDFLSRDYFEHIVAEADESHSPPLLAIVTNLHFYFEDRDQFSDTHPLRYRFDNGTKRLRSGDLENYIHMATHSIFLHRPTLAEKAMIFDASVKPSFEDAHLINRLFVSAPDRTVSFLSRPKYYYRKRSNGSSLLDNAKSVPEYFLDQLDNGCLNLLKYALDKRGYIPRHVQRTCLYDMMWHIRYVIDHSERADFLTAEQKARFLELTREIFAYIDADVIVDFNLAGCSEEHRVALLALYKAMRREKHSIYLEQIDTGGGLAQFSYFTGGDDAFDIDVEVNGKPVAPVWRSQKIADFMGQVYFRRRYFWVPMQDGDDIRFSFEGAPCAIKRNSHLLRDEADWLRLRNAVVPTTPRITDPATARLREYVIARRDVYRDCYVLMDRDDKADDNAEHLYRHMMKTGRADNAWFVLARSSLDWDRLAGEGFKLLEFGSDDHVAAQMNAAALLSSHVDHHILWPVEKRDFVDLARYQFVFLQHGVTINDLSLWLNTKPIRLFVTVTPDEARSIAAPDGKYVFSEREVLRSGFPRHDALLVKAAQVQQDAILIMPTWRKYLTDETMRNGMERGKVAEFAESDYARNWGAVLRDPRLRDLAERHGKKVVFVPHPNVAMYLDEMPVPDWIEQIDVRQGISYQDLLSRAAVAMTCYSSAVTEVAFLQRPIIYFQFDAEAFFSGGHICREGYFSFKRDGFGPVAETPDAVFTALAAALEGKEDPVYKERRERAFPFRDGNCCERVCEAVERLLNRSGAHSPPVLNAA